MELQFQSNACRCLKSLVREVCNTELTQEVRLSDGMPDIGRVLASWGQIILRSKEWQTDQVTVSGGIMVWILYAPEDGTPPRCMDTWVPFQVKWETEHADSEGPVHVHPLLRFVDSRGTSARKVMVRAGVALMGEAYVPMVAQVYSPAEIPEDIQLLKNTYPIRIPKEAGEKTFLLDEEMQLPAGSVQPERLLAYTITPQIHEKRVSDDKVILRGSGKIHIIYRCKEGKVHSADMELPFSQFAQLENSYGSDAQADTALGITSLELQQNEDTQLRVKCGIVIQYLITDRYLAEVTEDAYSPYRNLERKLEELNLPSVLEQRTELVQVQQKQSGNEGIIADAVFLPDFPRQSRKGDQLTLELTGQFQLLYYTADESLQGSTVRWESTLQILSDADTHLSCQVLPVGAVQAASGMDEMNLNAQMKLELQTYMQTSIPAISALVMGDPAEPDPERPSLILCRMEDQTLWDIAKRCGSTVDEIRRINQLGNESDPEQMLLIPVI